MVRLRFAIVAAIAAASIGAAKGVSAATMDLSDLADFADHLSPSLLAVSSGQVSQNLVKAAIQEHRHEVLLQDSLQEEARSILRQIPGPGAVQSGVPVLQPPTASIAPIPPPPPPVPEVKLPEGGDEEEATMKAPTVDLDEDLDETEAPATTVAPPNLNKRTLSNLPMAHLLVDDGISRVFWDILTVLSVPLFLGAVFIQPDLDHRSTFLAILAGYYAVALTFTAFDLPAVVNIVLGLLAGGAFAWMAYNDLYDVNEQGYGTIDGTNAALIVNVLYQLYAALPIDSINPSYTGLCGLLYLHFPIEISVDLWYFLVPILPALLGGYLLKGYNHHLIAKFPLAEQYFEAIPCAFVLMTAVTYGLWVAGLASYSPWDPVGFFNVPSQFRFSSWEMYFGFALWAALSYGIVQYWESQKKELHLEPSGAQGTERWISRAGDRVEEAA